MMIHNLEAELVVVSIEALHLLSICYQSSPGGKKKALRCLDRIETYMKEQYDRDNELFSSVMNRLSNGDSFIFSEGGATSALEGEVFQRQDVDSMRVRKVYSQKVAF